MPKNIVRLGKYIVYIVVVLVGLLIAIAVDELLGLRLRKIS
jgi:hypothetical protein